MRLFEVFWSFGQALSRKLRASTGNGPFRSEILPALTNVVCLSTLGPRTCVSFPHTHTTPHAPALLLLPITECHTPNSAPTSWASCVCVSAIKWKIFELLQKAHKDINSPNAFDGSVCVHSQIQLEITITAIKLRERARMPMEKQGANTLPKYIWLQEHKQVFRQRKCQRKASKSGSPGKGWKYYETGPDLKGQFPNVKNLFYY